MKDLVNNIVNKNAYSGTKVVISADAARFFIKKYARTHKKQRGDRVAAPPYQGNGGCEVIATSWFAYLKDTFLPLTI